MSLHHHQVSVEKQTFAAAQRLQEVHSITAFLAEQLAVPGRVAGSPRGYQEGKSSHGLELHAKAEAGIC